MYVANDPGILPTSTFAKLTSRSAIPPFVIKIPARTKNGTANKEKLSIPVTSFWPAVKIAISNGNWVSIVAIEAIAIAIEMGTLKTSKTAKTINKTRPA